MIRMCPLSLRTRAFHCFERCERPTAASTPDRWHFHLNHGASMTLSATLTDYVNAAFSGISLVSHEADEAEREIAQLARQKEWRLAAWDVSGGLRFPIAAHSAPLEIGAGDPLAVLRALPAL